jgi:RND superfamily putative drug exporter
VINRLSELATHRARRVLLLAGVLFLAAAAVGVPLLGTLKATSSDFQDPAAQNLRATDQIQRATHQNPTLGLVALVHSGDVRADPAARRKVARIAQLIKGQAGFQRETDYVSSPSPLLVSRDGRETLVLAAFATQDEARTAAEHLRTQLAGHGVQFGGRDVAFSQISHQVSKDLEHAELLALPILLALSFLVFRGLIAALLPLLVGGLSIVTTFLFLRGVNAADSLSIFALNLVTGMGLGLAIDYSLFVVSRFREELAKSGSPPVAIRRTLATAGRTVLYSSVTVAGAMASMLVFPLRFLYSMGFGGMIVALVAGGVSLIVLPAVLVVLGHRVNSLAPARVQRSRQQAERATTAGAWFRLAHLVMRRPGMVATLTALALLFVALPALRLNLSPADPRVLPVASEVHQVSTRLAQDFPVDTAQQIAIVARASATDRAAVASLAGHLPAGVIAAPPRYLGAGTWELGAFPHGDALSAANQRLVSSLRAMPTPVPIAVGGATAAFIDQKTAIAAHLPAALAIVAVVTLTLLFLMTGSLILPLLAFAMNLLTVAVGAGLLVFVFQDGHLRSLLDFQSVGGLEESNLVLLFTLAFALSTDYGVFLFGRIKEARDSGLPSREAIALGLERTGRLVTAAALLFCVAIGAFMTSQILFIKQLGFGTALAVAIDATFVRALLVPALMGRLGDRAWWAPRPLRRLHDRIGLAEGGHVEGAAA